MKNPLLAGKPLVFMKRRRFVSQMLHEYLGYFYDYGDVAGGGVYVLGVAGQFVQHARPDRRPASQGQLHHAGAFLRRRHGLVRLLPAGRDEARLLLARAAVLSSVCDGRRRGEPPPGDHSAPTTTSIPARCPTAAWPSCPRAAAASAAATIPGSRCRPTRCTAWSPTAAVSRTLSFHETNQWHPSVLDDGRIALLALGLRRPLGGQFPRHLDQQSRRHRGPDALRQLHGADQRLLSAPGDSRLAADRVRRRAHHAVVGGSLVIVDPTRVRLDPKTGEDDLASIEVLTPEVCFPEAPDWPKSFFHSPWPLSEDYYLVGVQLRSAAGHGAGSNEDTETGLYYFDRFGNLELLYREAGISAMYPIPLTPRPTPPVVPECVDPRLGDEGELFLADVRRSLMPLPADRPIRPPARLPGAARRRRRTWPTSRGSATPTPRAARMLLGTVPVEPDGSAYFRVPARQAALLPGGRRAGRAVQTMRSVIYLQPGERRSCVGCHEPPGTAAAATPLAALGRPPSHDRAGPRRHAAVLLHAAGAAGARPALRALPRRQADGSGQAAP